MTKAAALQGFFAGFGIPAFPAADVPEGQAFPYLTYDATFGSWEQGEQNITVNLWYYSTSETEVNAKEQELATAIGYGGTKVECDGGDIWLKRGSPWAQALMDDIDKKIKRRYINVTAEFLTFD